MSGGPVSFSKGCVKLATGYPRRAFGRGRDPTTPTDQSTDHPMRPVQLVTLVRTRSRWLLVRFTFRLLDGKGKSGDGVPSFLYKIYNLPYTPYTLNPKP